MLLLLATLLFRPFDEGLPRAGQWRHGFAVADMNGDGRADLAFTSPRKQPGPPVIFLNEGGGRWRRWQEARFPALPFDYGSVTAADFDGNGTMDLAVASHYRGVTVILGDGRGNFAPSQAGLAFRTPSPPFTSRAVVATDWNGDGRPDVAALSDGPRPGDPTVQLGVTLFENLGYAWKPVRAEKDVVFGDAIAAGDVDGDRLPDLVTSSSNAADRAVLRLGADGALLRRELATSRPASVVQAVALHDFDRDGRDEIVIGYGTMVEVLSYPEGSRLLVEYDRRVAAVAAGDVNGDGAAEVVAALDDGRLVIGDAVLDPPAWRRACSPWAVRVADLDGDGRAEVIAAFAGDALSCATGGGVEVWRSELPPKRRRPARTSS